MSTAADYCTYYQTQMGGELRVFRGGLQSGAGLGDVLRGLFRFLAPIALRGLSTFAGNTLAAHQAGVPLAYAAKGAILPTITAVTGSAAPGVTRLMNRVVPGLVGSPARTEPQPNADGTAKQDGGGTLFDGTDGIPTTDRAIRQYKRGGFEASPECIAKRVKKLPRSNKRRQPVEIITRNWDLD